MADSIYVMIKNSETKSITVTEHSAKFSDEVLEKVAYAMRNKANTVAISHSLKELLGSDFVKAITEVA